MACPVFGHDVAHMLQKLLAVLGLRHVYEVYHYDAAHVAQPKLTGYLVGRPEVYLKRVCLLILRSLAAVAGIDIDHMQSLRMLDDQIGA